MADSASPDGPPPFEEVFRADDVEQGIFGTILQTREPATASAIADQAECDPKTARKYLSWFADLGIVTRYAGHPATYERNGAYFEWRRINQLAAEQPVEDLQERARELASPIDAYEDGTTWRRRPMSMPSPSRRPATTGESTNEFEESKFASSGIQPCSVP